VETTVAFAANQCLLMRCNLNLVSTLLANRTSLVGFVCLFVLVSGLISSFSLLFFNLGERRRVVLLWNLGDRLGDFSSPPDFAVFMGVILIDQSERLRGAVKSKKPVSALQKFRPEHSTQISELQAQR
jgi:hypothetical protein